MVMPGGGGPDPQSLQNVFHTVAIVSSEQDGGR